PGGDDRRRHRRHRRAARPARGNHGPWHERLPHGDASQSGRPAKGAVLHVTHRPPAVDARDLTVSLGGRPTLRGISIQVAQGEVVALLGANGSGKSTLVRTLVGLVPPQAGGIELFGVPLERFKDWHRIGYVPQRVTAVSAVPATVREFISSGRLARARIGRPLRRGEHAAGGPATERE